MRQADLVETDNGNRSLFGPHLKRWCKAARKRANLSQSRLAEALSLPLRKVALWESPQRVGELPSESQVAKIAEVTGCALVIEDSVETPVLSLRNDIRTIPVQRAATTVSDEIVAIGEVLSGLVSSPEKRARDAALFAQRYGVDGPDEISLQSIGLRWGLTKEGVRRTIARMLTRGAAHRVSFRAEQFLRLAEEIQALGECAPGHLDASLRHRLGTALSLADAQRFSKEILGRRLPLLQPLFEPSQGPGQSVILSYPLSGQPCCVA